jgi:uncharacterized protein (TIGR02231 family)
MKTLSVILALVFAGNVFAGDDEQKVQPEISSVIVYLTGAEIMHKQSVILNPGRNELVFVGLSSKLLPKSIQFTGSGDVSVLAISNRVDYLFGQKKSDERVKQLNDSLILMQDQYDVTQGQIEALEGEKQLLNANHRIGGSEKGVTAAELKLNADFYVARVAEINADLVKMRRKNVNQQSIITRIRLQLAEANRATNPPMGEIRVLLNNGVAAKVTSQIELRYVVSDAGWAPSYDLISEDVSKPVELKYRAKVFNNTLVDWKNVKMRLSTTDPMRSASAPELAPWTLNFESDNNRNNYNYDKGYNDNAPASISGQNLYNQRAPAPVQEGQVYQQQQKQQPQVQYDAIQVSELSAEFDIKQQYDIPADGKPYIVDVTAYTLNATYQYRTVPKMEKEAFLMARITGWEELDLVEGPANVYFGGTYVGQSYINTRTVEDTLDLSLGRDQKLVVTRTKLKEFNTEKSTSSIKKETYSYEIVIKNTRKAAVQVDLRDQIPVSQNSEIIVEKTELSKGELDPATGEVKWMLTIPPGESVKVILTYSVKYPKNKKVNTRKYKTRSRAAF